MHHLGLKFEILISKSQTNHNSPILQIPNYIVFFISLEHWNLEFGICLEIRIWSLEFDFIGLIRQRLRRLNF